MYGAHIILLTLLCKLVEIRGDSLHPLSDEFIQLINKEGKWEAGRNFPANTPKEYLKRLATAHLNHAKIAKLPTMRHNLELIESLPESFDPREKWPQCSSLNEIRDQGECGACWAISAAETWTDRVCIYSNGTKNFHFSAEDVLTCNSEFYGCEGGDPITAWEDWVKEGFVSGGNYNSHEGCKPYSMTPCANHMKNCLEHKPTPACVHSCQDGYSSSFDEDRKRGKEYYFVQNETNIMAELYEHGPVAAFFIVFEDLADYKSGVYQHVKGNPVGGHVVKLMGWGVDNGTKYWLTANSWGPSFGENGFFKLLRGSNECDVEEFVLAGAPLLEDY